MSIVQAVILLGLSHLTCGISGTFDNIFQGPGVAPFNSFSQPTLPSFSGTSTSGDQNQQQFPSLSQAYLSPLGTSLGGLVSQVPASQDQPADQQTQTGRSQYQTGFDQFVPARNQGSQIGFGDFNTGDGNDDDGGDNNQGNTRGDYDSGSTIVNNIPSQTTSTTSAAPSEPTQQPLPSQPTRGSQSSQPTPGFPPSQGAPDSPTQQPTLAPTPSITFPTSSGPPSAFSAPNPAPSGTSAPASAPVSAPSQSAPSGTNFPPQSPPTAPSQTTLQVSAPITSNTSSLFLSELQGPQAEDCTTAIEGLQQDGNFDFFLTMLRTAGLEDIFRKSELVGTLFVVEDEGFERVFDKFGLTNETFMSDRFITQIAAYNVIDGQVYFENLKSKSELETALPGARIQVTKDDQEKLTLIPIVTDFAANIIKSDIRYCNTIVHVISNLMVAAFNSDSSVINHPNLPLNPPRKTQEPAPLQETDSLFRQNQIEAYDNQLSTNNTDYNQMSMNDVGEYNNNDSIQSPSMNTSDTSQTSSSYSQEQYDYYGSYSFQVAHSNDSDTENDQVVAKEEVFIEESPQDSRSFTPDEQGEPYTPQEPPQNGQMSGQPQGSPEISAINYLAPDSKK